MCCVAIDDICGFFLEPASYFGHYASIDLETAKGTVDTVFMGSSWTYMGYDCSLYDERTGAVSFNAGTIGQSTIDSYYYLKEIKKNNPIKTVYYNIHQLKLQTPKSTIHTMVVNDRLSGINRWKHLINAVNPKDLGNISKAYRYREQLWKTSIINNVKSKMTSKYREGEWINDSDMQKHVKMGFIESHNKIQNSNNENFVLTDKDWEIGSILAYNMTYLNKIVELCAEEDIQLILVTPPFTLGFLQATGHYEDFSRFISSYASEKGLEYLDFNKLVDSPFVDEELFTDTSHLNYMGAELFTTLLCDYRNQSENVKFYNDFLDREDVYKYCGGVNLNVDIENDTALLSATAANDTDIELLYRFSRYNAQTGGWEVITDYSSDNQYRTRRISTNIGYKVECRGKASEKDYDAFSEKYFGDIQTSDGLVLCGELSRDRKVLSLVGGKVRDTAEYQFSKWKVDGSYEIIQDYSKSNRCDIKLLKDGMYRYRMTVRDATSHEKIGIIDYFIDTNASSD